MFSLSAMLPSGSLPELAESVRRGLSSVQAQIAAAWNVQHNADGTHRDLTTPRVRASHIGLAGTFLANAGNAIACAPLLVPARVTLVDVLSNNGATPVDVYGIQQDGVQHGDILIICMARAPGGSGGVNLHCRPNGASPGTTPIGTEITWDLNVVVTSPLNLGAQSHASPLLLMYLPERGSAQTSAWSILRGLS